MNRSAEVLRSARREAVVTGILWLLACVWTVGYSAVFAYPPQPQVELIYGIPAWVVWGVLLPWTVCTLFTCWYAMAAMKDVDLGEAEAPHEETAGA